MKAKKLWGILLSVVMVMTLLSGCGKGNNTKGDQKTSTGDTLKEAASESPAKKGDKIITWMFWDDLEATTDLMSKQYAEVIKRFNKADNGYHCNVVTTNLEEYDTKLNALIAAGQAPDVWICNPGPNMKQYVDAGVVMDLTDILNKDTKWKNSFSEGMFSNLTYDNKIMAIPTNFAAACVFYNKDIFKKAGVEIPKTWDDFIAACKKIKAAGYSPISISAGTSWCLSMVAGYLCDREGGPDNLEGINNGTAKWTDKSFVEAAKKLKDLSAYFQPTYVGDSNDQATANFYKGNAAMLVQGSWAIAQINGNNAKMQDKCGVFQFPGITGGADPNRWIVKTDNLLVSKNTKNKDACIALLKAFTDETAQKATAEIAGKMPSCKVDIDYSKAPKQLKDVQDCMKTVTGTLDFYNESLATVEAGKEFDNKMVSIVMGDMSVQDGLAALQKFYDDNIKK
ncbi:sugar ABC transporter sugar-binding protein [Lachnospiraceae bacterium KM106-2]|nr:sugar ABC transporter sugar-binding protein [Lachnospiraceae bacterium KM106-2]